MKLKSVRVREFQSVQDSNEFEIGDITCLVGKNEAGKTSILQALYHLNPIIESEGNFDVTNDYPRANVEDYQQDVESQKRKPATVVSARLGGMSGRGTCNSVSSLPPNLSHTPTIRSGTLLRSQAMAVVADNITLFDLCLDGFEP